MMKRSWLLLAALPLGIACDSSTAPDPIPLSDAASSRETRDVAQDVIVDYVTPRTHAGPGAHPTEESDRYSLFNGGIRWFNGGTVEYRILGSAPSGGNNAIVAGEQAWDDLIPNRTFARNDKTSQTNPCTEEPSTIEWAAIDGPGGILGYASPCYNLLTKEILGFTITLDNSEQWATNGAADAIDIANVATHEFGHAVGLAHVGSPRDGCLTMYKFTMEGEIQKRTPGWGDKLGMAFLYGNTDTSQGACGS